MHVFRNRVLSLSALVLIAVACFGWQQQRSVSADPPSEKASSQKNKKKTKTSRKPNRGNQATGQAGDTMDSGNNTGGGSVTGNGGTGNGGTTGSSSSGTASGQGPKASGTAAPPSTKSNPIQPAPPMQNAPPPGRLDVNHPLVKKVIGVQNRMTADLMKQKGIVGTCTGLDEDGNVVIKVNVTGADSPTIPKQVEGITVLEVLTGPYHLYWQSPPFNPTARQTRPVPIGVSAFDDVSGTGFCFAGTLGCRLRDKKGNVYGLSNNHVFAGENGTNLGVVIGTNVVQPSPGDDNCITGIATDVIGALFKFKPVATDGTTPNVIDSAIITTDRKLVSNSTPAPPTAYGAPRTQVWLNPFLGMNVQKLGRTTGFTKGFVSGLNVQLSLAYGNGTAFFVDQIEISPTNAPLFSNAGDSGSLIVSDELDGDRFPVALLFAGAGPLTAANPIQAVLDFYDMTVDGDDSPVIPPGKSARSQPNSP